MGRLQHIVPGGLTVPPFPIITKKQYVRAYFLEARTHQVRVADGKLIIEAALPTDLPEWHIMKGAH